MYVDKDKKKDLLKFILKNPKLSRVIVFCRTKHGADKVVKILDGHGNFSRSYSRNKSQGARQRALEDFREGAKRVLVATDIAARGIDIDDISHVINYEIPISLKAMCIELARTARAGAQGIAISFCDSEEKAFM
jgi:ATP-dependent RNA helicase RhlE